MIGAALLCLSGLQLMLAWGAVQGFMGKRALVALAALSLAGGVLGCWLIGSVGQRKREAGRGRDDGGADAVAAVRLIRRDPLTSLANRYMFDEMVNSHLAGGARGAVLLLDIDDFRGLNDTLGFAAGDTLLQQVSDRLRAAAPGSSVVAHLFSDDFAILNDGPPDDAEAFALEILRIFDTPFDCGSGRPRLSASIGIALAPVHGTDSNTLLHAASLALRAAQAAGRGSWRVSGSADRLTADTLLAALPAALEDGQIVPFYQPIIHIESGQVAGMEVLARWRHPDQGLLRSSVFIGVADTAGLLGAVTRRLMQCAAHDSAAWPDSLFFAFNVAASQLAEVDELMAGLGSGERLAPERVALELTETTPVEDIAAARGQLEALRARGMRVSLDDFGAGYANLHTLLGLPFDGLKIDQEFVVNVLTDARAEMCVRAIAEGARTLGLKVTAEGVRTPEIAARVAALGCQFVQGSLFSMPVPANEVGGVLTRLGLLTRAGPGHWQHTGLHRAA